jgi:hypothetical protein
MRTPGNKVAKCLSFEQVGTTIAGWYWITIIPMGIDTDHYLNPNEKNFQLANFLEELPSPFHLHLPELVEWTTKLVSHPQYYAKGNYSQSTEFLKRKIRGWEAQKDEAQKNLADVRIRAEKKQRGGGKG